MKHVIQTPHGLTFHQLHVKMNTLQQTPDSESGNEMLEADGHDSVANFQDGDISSLCNSQYALTRQLPMSHIRALPRFQLCGDNVDKVVTQRYMRPDSVHYFHSYA